MSLYRHPKSQYWWVRFTIGGREVRESTGTKDRAPAEEYEHALRGRYWRAVRLGESVHTWGEATTRWLRERAAKRSLKRDQQIFNEYADLSPLPLRELTTDALAAIREAREKALRTGSDKLVTPAAVNREFALLRAVLFRAKKWGWLDELPNVPMAQIEAQDPPWITRTQAKRLIRFLPKHLSQMARFGLSTGIRRGNVTGLTWDQVDLRRRFAYVPGSAAKGKRGIPVPLNDDAMAVLRERRDSKVRHATYVFTWRKRRITSVVTKAWRKACIKAGVPGLWFHHLRHTWASWQAQAGTPGYAIREMGGWASDVMVRRYAHLGAPELAQWADRTLLKVGTPEKRRSRQSA